MLAAATASAPPAYPTKSDIDSLIRESMAVIRTIGEARQQGDMGTASTLAVSALNTCDTLLSGTYDRPPGVNGLSRDVEFLNETAKTVLVESTGSTILENGLFSHLPRVLDKIMPQFSKFRFPATFMMLCEAAVIADDSTPAVREERLQKIESTWLVHPMTDPTANIRQINALMEKAPARGRLLPMALAESFKTADAAATDAYSANNLLDKVIIYTTAALGRLSREIPDPGQRAERETLLHGYVEGAQQRKTTLAAKEAAAPAAPATNGRRKGRFLSIFLG